MTRVNLTSPQRKQGGPLLALRASIAVAMLSFVTANARAELDAEADKPYKLDVVLHIGANRVFTPLFEKQLRRDIESQLKLSFGRLAQINVTRDHPILSDVDAKGLSPALEAWDAISDRATHVVLLEYTAGMYRVRSRFHDGMTNLARPMSVTAQTADRQAVAPLIARMIEESFHPVGTIVGIGKDVTLRFKGGSLGVAMDRWVKTGHVFAVSRVSEEAGRRRAMRVDWALLEVIDAPASGACRCRYWHRYKEDALIEEAGTLGYRAVHLPTARRPVKVQLLDEATSKPAVGVTVKAGAPGAEGKKLDLMRDGLWISSDAHAHWAWVQIVAGKNVRAQFPIALVDDRATIVRVKDDTAFDASASLLVRRDAWLRRAYENAALTKDRNRELAGLLNQSLQSAFEVGKKSLPTLQAEIKYLDRERGDLDRLAKDKKLSFDFREGQRQIDELRRHEADVAAFVDRVERVLKEADGSEKELGLHKRIERARLYAAEADFDSAIRLYDQVVQASPVQSKVKAHVEQLKIDWATKGPRHVEARRFIYETWPTLTPSSLGKHLKDADQALAVCRERDVGDKLTVRKLLRVNLAHTAKLKAELESLKKSDREDNRNKAKALAEVIAPLLRLHDSATEFVSGKTP
ncbi:MAG: hypothetical protein FJ303_23420 [Planctomycetes bacterium]|nr:hypothetical protein [Planctomycetota bacterium]